jgi:hypothetical protein
LEKWQRGEGNLKLLLSSNLELLASFEEMATQRKIVRVFSSFCVILLNYESCGVA